VIAAAGNDGDSEFDSAGLDASGSGGGSAVACAFAITFAITFAFACACASAGAGAGAGAGADHFSNASYHVVTSSGSDLKCNDKHAGGSYWGHACKFRLNTSRVQGD
jgi:hypothetical protein